MESDEQRRGHRRGSADGKSSTAARAVAATTKSGRTVIDSGKQIGRNLAELAKSSVTIAPAPAPAEPSTEPQPPSNGSGGRHSSSPAAPTSAPPPAAALARPVAPAPTPGTTTTTTARGRAVPSSTRAAASMAASRLTSQPIRRRTDPSEEYEFIVPSFPRRARVRLYPPWWRRVFSFVVLGALILLCGLAVGTAIGALLAFLNRFIQSSL